MIEIGLEHITQQTRVVSRTLETGGLSNLVFVDPCPVCKEEIKWSSPNVLKKSRLSNAVMVANVYVEGAWDRVEGYHAACYDGRYGEPQ